VATENISRGGFAFTSARLYVAGSSIQVAVPYSPGAGNIFVPAQIEYAEAVPELGLTRYGVSYIPVHRGWPGN
jgi:hypothetical protein